MYVKFPHIQTCNETIVLKCISKQCWGSGPGIRCFLTPGSEIRDEHQRSYYHIPKSLAKICWVQNSGIQIWDSAIFSTLDSGSGMEKFEFGIGDEHPGYATLLFLNTDFKRRFCCCWCHFCHCPINTCVWCSFQLFLPTETYPAHSLITRTNRNFRYLWNSKIFIFKISWEPVSIGSVMVEKTTHIVTV